MKLTFGLLAALAVGGCLDSRPGTVADASDADADALVDTEDGADGVDAFVTDTAVPDTAVVDTAVVDVAPDTLVADTAAPDPCTGPLRISPTHGSTIGGDLVVAEGVEFYIGALTWMMKIGSAPATEMLYGEGVPMGPCRIAFRTPPNPPGTYAVYVYYGWGEPDPAGREPGDAGTFTYEE